MNIAIITWYDNLNFGTALQAYALQNYLKQSFNANVKLIAYKPNKDNILQSKEKKMEHIVFKTCQKIKNFIYDDSKLFAEKLNTQLKKENDLKKENFRDFLSNISFTDEVKSADDFAKLNAQFDIFICGSDQIWNPQILDKNYYLAFAKNKIKIAYAASFGISYIPDYAKSYIKSYLDDFRAIGLRESTCKNELSAITGRSDINVVCDPTLLYDKEFWHTMGNNKLNSGEKYFTTYFLGDSQVIRSSAQKVQNTLGIKNIIIPATNFMADIAPSENIAFGPADFISLIENSEFVLTDSFHAVCFSIIFQKNFCVLKKHSQNNPFRQNSRIESLLDLLGLRERLVDNIDEMNKIIHKPIDYTAVHQRLSQFITSSKQFLENNIRDNYDR